MPKQKIKKHVFEHEPPEIVPYVPYVYRAQVNTGSWEGEDDENLEDVEAVMLPTSLVDRLEDLCIRGEFNDVAELIEYWLERAE